ncbi:MAG: hypothetical protein CR965_01835 [Paludibacter sp.]|nr:MAG: hypothetical protein CR965_01835 [Paludibacter sp.]
MCLVDKLKSRRPKGATDKEIQKFHQLAQTIVLTSQGIPFIYAGEEIYRDKKGVNNTYKSPDNINQINWDNKKTYNHIFNYYKDLIALRKSHSAFRMTTGEMVRKHFHFIDTKVPNVIAYQLSDNANGDEWNNIMVIFNGNRKNVKISLPKGTWNVAVENGKVGLEKPLRTVSSEKITVKASSATILYQK